MRILLTAYGPFLSVQQNITEKVADKIQAQWNDAEKELFILKMPVDWQVVEQSLPKAIKQLHPDVIVSLGHAESYSAIVIETRYINLAEGTDVQDKTRRRSVIVPGAPAYYTTNIDAQKLAFHLCQKASPAMFSTDQAGGAYLCNFAGYIAMHHILSQSTKKPLFIFLHLPPDSILPFDTLVQGVKETIKFLISQCKEVNP